MLFRPPPRITLKLKMPKALSKGNANPTFKPGLKTCSYTKPSGLLCPDISSNLSEHTAEGLGLGKPQLHTCGGKEECSNGRLMSSGHPNTMLLTGRPTSKHLALQAAFHSHSSNSNGKLDQDLTCLPKSNGVLEKPQKDSSCQTPNSRDASKQDFNFRKSAMERFGRSFKEATINLVRTTESLRVSENLSRKSSTKDRLWAAPVLENKVKKSRSYQDSDGYCPDLELSDSEPEAKGRCRQTARFLQDKKAKQSFGSRTTTQR